MAAEAGTVTFIYRGGGRDTVPRDATHVIMHESVTVIPAEVFKQHPNIVEVYCHVDVKKIERHAFASCPRIKRVIMPGVEAVETSAFYWCQAIEYVKCPKLERIGFCAFNTCTSLSSIDLPSAKVVQQGGFYNCDAIKSASFGKNVESIETASFDYCSSLERITIPLKNGLFGDEDCNEIFQDCANLKRIDLVETEELDETIAALNLEEWRNDMTAEINSINQTLPNAEAGFYDAWEDEYIIGEKTTAMRDWIDRTLSKITHYKAQHVELLDEAAETLKNVAPSDIVVESVIPFLELPTHTFDGENIDRG